MTRYPDQFDRIAMERSRYGVPQLSLAAGHSTLVVPALNLAVSGHALHAGTSPRWLARAYLVFIGVHASSRRTRDEPLASAALGTERDLVDFPPDGDSASPVFELGEAAGQDEGTRVLAWTIRAERFVLCVPDDHALLDAPAAIEAALAAFLEAYAPASVVQIPLATKRSLLMTASKNAGRCLDCRHANQETVDLAEGHVFCRWDQAPRNRTTTCDVPVELSVARGRPRESYFLFEVFDGANGSYGLACDARMMPEDASPALRATMLADRSNIDVGEELE